RIREQLPTSSRHFQTSWQRTPALWWPPSPSQAAHPLQLPHTHSSKQPEPRPRRTDRREENILWNLYVFIVDLASTWSPPAASCLSRDLCRGCSGFLSASSNDGALNHSGERGAGGGRTGACAGEGGEDSGFPGPSAIGAFFPPCDQEPPWVPGDPPCCSVLQLANASGLFSL
ncbi:LOW QUALITY PROTEIN: hypothetical protein Nmel_017318, partial [Mimus melanotis]